jgi:hypothetical protein
MDFSLKILFFIFKTLIGIERRIKMSMLETLEQMKEYENRLKICIIKIETKMRKKAKRKPNIRKGKIYIKLKNKCCDFGY